MGKGGGQASGWEKEKLFKSGFRFWPPSASSSASFPFHLAVADIQILPGESHCSRFLACVH